MSRQVSVAQAKQGLTRLLREAHRCHEEIIVTHRGRPFMVILPYEEYERLDRLRAYLSMVRIAEALKDSGVSATELHEESRRELEERY